MQNFDLKPCTPYVVYTIYIPKIFKSKIVLIYQNISKKNLIK